MRTIIAGSRSISPLAAMPLIEQAAKDCGWNITEVVSGGAYGVDTAAAIWANVNKIRFREFLADWEGAGLAAGPIRNRRMASYTAEKQGSLILIWNGRSKGSANMKREAEKFELRIYEIMVE